MEKRLNHMEEEHEEMDSRARHGRPLIWSGGGGSVKSSGSDLDDPPTREPWSIIHDELFQVIDKNSEENKMWTVGGIVRKTQET